MTLVRCRKCGKGLVEVDTGEFKKICPRCKEISHFLVFSGGILMFNDNENFVMLPNGPSEYKQIEMRTDMMSDTSSGTEYRCSVNMTKR